MDDDIITAHGADELHIMGIAMNLEAVFGLMANSVSEESLLGETTVTKCVQLVEAARH